MRYPLRRLKHRRARCRRKLIAPAAGEYLESRVMLSTVDVAPINGFGNNIDNPQWGSVDTQLLRLTGIDYADGISSPAGTLRPSARDVSNVVVAQDGPIANDRFLTDIVWLWGQFLDHDIDLTEAAMPEEPFPVSVPQGDQHFDPDGTGTRTIDLNRSIYDLDTGDSISNPRQQINQITAFIDGSVVYGSDSVRAAALRAGEGGRLKTSAGDLLPFNEGGLPNAGGTEADLFLAGDVRANENAALSAMHTLFVREHNRIADEIAAADSTLSDDDIYERARAIVTAEIQSITYNEFLPALLGPGALGSYTGYDPSVNPGISNIFSTAAYRVGHSLLSPELLRLDSSGQVIEAGNLSLREAFFAPQELIDQGIDSLLRGLASQTAQEVDTMIVDDVRNFLFGPPGAGGFDLASLNIQRGRDHGLPDYNQARVDLGLDPVTTFSDITSDVSLQNKLAQVYGDVDSIDVWVGGLAEDHLPGASVGELIHTVLVDQFERLRSGDRFWYQNILDGAQRIEVENTTLADVIERNTGISGLRENVFLAESALYYKVPAGHASAEIALQSDGLSIEIVDYSNGSVLASGPAGDVDQVVVIGSDNQNERFLVDLQGDWTSLGGGIVVHGGWQDHDEWVVNGTRARDTIVIDGQEIDAGGAAMRYTGIELLTVDAADGNDVVYVHTGSQASLVLKGGRGHDILVGSHHSDTIYGNAGNDWIFGRDGDDLLYGGAGNDVIVGGAGDDKLVGGPGRDVMIGGPGDDHYDGRREHRTHSLFPHFDTKPSINSSRTHSRPATRVPVVSDYLNAADYVLQRAHGVFTAAAASGHASIARSYPLAGEPHDGRTIESLQDRFFASNSHSAVWDRL